jgi:hypothetical protein
VVRSESDMGGRVSLVAIALWTVEELEFIAHEESEALNIEGQHGVATKLAENIHRIANRTPPEPYWNLGRPPPPHNSTKNPAGAGLLRIAGAGLIAKPATAFRAWALWDLASQRWICERMW